MKFTSHVVTGETLQLAWGNKVDKEFRDSIFDICERMGWGLDLTSCLMSCIAFESGETFSPSVKNAAGSGATGLIQFMPSTARDLGTTTSELAKMSPMVQLEYVYAYFTKYGWHKKIKTLEDMYMAILLPKYISAPPSRALFSGGISYRQNSGLDANSDGIVTKAEATGKVRAKLERGLREPFVLSIALPYPMQGPE